MVFSKENCCDTEHFLETNPYTDSSKMVCQELFVRGIEYKSKEALLGN